MDRAVRDRALRILAENRILSIATIRPDGWPQATVVGYVNEGLLLYAFITRLGQKHANIARDPRVSLTIARDFSDPREISGISMAATAAIVQERDEFDRLSRLFFKRFPEFASWQVPSPSLAPLIRLTPTVMSVLDYSVSFGHSDLIEMTEDDLREAIA